MSSDDVADEAAVAYAELGAEQAQPSGCSSDGADDCSLRRKDWRHGQHAFLRVGAGGPQREEVRRCVGPAVADPGALLYQEASCAGLSGSETLGLSRTLWGSLGQIHHDD